MTIFCQSFCVASHHNVKTCNTRTTRVWESSSHGPSQGFFLRGQREAVRAEFSTARTTATTTATA